MSATVSLSLDRKSQLDAKCAGCVRLAEMDFSDCPLCPIELERNQVGVTATCLINSIERGESDG